MKNQITFKKETIANLEDMPNGIKIQISNNHFYTEMVNAFQKSVGIEQTGYISSYSGYYKEFQNYKLEYVFNKFSFMFE